MGSRDRLEDRAIRGVGAIHCGNERPKKLSQCSVSFSIVIDKLMDGTESLSIAKVRLS